MAAWTIEVGGSVRSYRQITFNRSLASDPTNFSAEIKYYSDIDYWDIVEIKNGTTTEWYGYLEKKKTKWNENGRYMEIGGRCRKVILWKKWTERFTDTRLNGFFGSVKASELLKFLIRCPVSDNPVDDAGNSISNHKIGWGIRTANWIVRASPTGVHCDPFWVKARYSGLAWQNSGSPYNNQILDVNQHVSGATPWTKAGVNPYLHDAGGEPEDGSKASTITPLASDDYMFADLTIADATATGINNVKLHYYYKTDGGGHDWNKAAWYVYIWDDALQTWILVDQLATISSNYKERIINITPWINSIDTIDNLKVRFVNSSSLRTVHITYCWVNVSYSVSGTQGTGDYFVIDLDESDDVMGILIECRKNIDNFARNYSIEYSNAENPDPANDGDWTAFPTAISVTGNIFRDILHSWKPTTLRHIRIKITDNKFAFDTVLLKIEAKLLSGSSVTPQYALYDGVGWGSWANFAEYTSSSYVVKSKDVTSFLSTNTKIDAARLAVQTTVGADEIRITHAYLELQKDGNTIARLSVDGWVNLTNEWTKTGSDPYINASDGDNNCISSVDDADGEEDQYYTFMDSTIDRVWEISQIYIFKAEDVDYRVVLDGASEGLGPYLGSIVIDSNFDAVIENVNIPFGRLINAIDSIAKQLHSSYVPFEWWVDIGDGDIHIEDHKGTDLSSSISFVKGTNLGGSTKEDDVSKTVQRARYVGKSEAKKQDDMSSDWQEDTAEMANINTFYEEVISKKTVSHKDLADLLANIFLTENAPPEEMIVCIVTNDTHAALDYDVGDDVEIVDSLTGVSGAHRIHTIKKVITQDGCTVTLYLDATYRDVKDEWARIYEKLRELSLTGTVVGDWLAEGVGQKKMKADETTESFERTARNDEEEGAADKNEAEKWTLVNDGVSGQSFDCGERWFTFVGTNVNGGGIRDVSAYIADPPLQLDQNPKLVAEVKIDTSGAYTTWRDTDEFDIWISAGGSPYKGIGFSIVKASGVYQLRAHLHDNVGLRNVLVMYLEEDTKYRLEAVCDFESGMVKYYVLDPDSATGELELVALLEIDEECRPESFTIYPCYMTFYTSCPDPPAGQRSKINIYKFRSEWRARG